MTQVVVLNLKFPSKSNVGALIHEKDWTTSSLGHPDTWPASLKSIVLLLLSSKFPMFVAWGSQLGFLYNDAYSEMLGDKHPSSLGAPFEEIWKEIWPEISPLIDSALSGESSYCENLPLVVNRTGRLENAWFTFSYSPVYDDAGVIAGMYCAVTETTKMVRDRNLRQFQLDLADQLHSLTSPQEIMSIATEMLARHLTAESCWYADIDDQVGTFHTRNGWFSSSMPRIPQSGRIEDFSGSLLPTLREGKEFIVNDLSSDPRTRDFYDRFQTLNIGSILVIPVVKAGRPTFTINVVKPGVYVWTGEDTRAARDVVDRTWIALENAVTQERLTIERSQSDYILDQMDEGLMVVGTDSRIYRINAEGLRLLQTSEESLLGRIYLDLWPDTVREALGSAYDAVSTTGKGSTIEVSFFADSSKIWWELNLSSLKNEGVAIFFRDVTEQKLAAQALRRSDEHLVTLFEQTSAGIAERDLQGRLIRVNERLCTILGRPRDAVLGVNILDLTHPDDVLKSEIAFKKLLSDGIPFEIEKRYVRPDGTCVWVNSTVSLIRSIDDKIADSVLSVILDVSERKHAEEALAAETRILELLNKSGQSLASTLDLNTLLQTVTDSGCALIGAEFGAFFCNAKDDNNDAYVLYTLSGAPREAFESFGHPRATPIFKPTFTGQPAIRSDDITKDPRYGQMSPHYGMPKNHLPVKSYLAAPVISRTGEVIGGLLFGHPRAAVFTERSERLITGLAGQAAMAIDNARLYERAQKAAEERQTLLFNEQAARAEAERMNRAKDEFLAMLAHELRNPLAPVSAAAELLRVAGNDAARVRQVSDILSRQIGHFTHLIDDLMDVSRVTRGLIELDIESLEIKSIVDTAMEQVRPMLEARQHSLSTHFDSGYCTVEGDRIRMVQVVANLLTNAIKYTPPRGQITLSVEAGNEDILITVNDNGNGIDAALLPYVFDLFIQGARSLDRTQGGLGIGLALVKAIIDLHRGDVQAHSDGAGMGSTFTIRLPRSQKVKNTLLEQENDNTIANPLSVLVVDDNHDAAELLSMLLEAVGNQVVTVSTAADAIALATSQHIDVFILDIGLPDMDGYTLAKVLRAHDSLAKKIYIALTGYGQPQDRQLSKEAGFAHHLVKPVDNQLLLNVLATVNTTTPQE